MIATLQMSYLMSETGADGIRFDIGLKKRNWDMGATGECAELLLKKAKPESNRIMSWMDFLFLSTLLEALPPTLEPRCSVQPACSAMANACTQTDDPTWVQISLQISAAMAGNMIIKGVFREHTGCYWSTTETGMGRKMFQLQEQSKYKRFWLSIWRFLFGHIGTQRVNQIW